MKQCCLLVAFLLPATAVFSQFKPFEFGVAVKAGNFSHPYEEQTEGSNFVYSYPGGASASFGVFAQQRFGGRLGLSAEMLYNFSAFKSVEKYSYRDGDYSFGHNIDQYYEVQSLMAPLKVHFSPKKNGRLSLSVGVSPTFLLASDLTSTYRDNTGAAHTTQVKDKVVHADSKDGIHWYFNAGGSCRLGEATSIGLEFTGTLRNNNRRQYSGYYYPGVIFCGDINEEIYPFWMKSLTVSIRHNVLH